MKRLEKRFFKKVWLIAILAVILFSNSALAIPLNGEYSIASNATQLGTNSWLFTYNVTNINQSSGSFTGLAGFYIQVPDTATISNIIIPPAYILGNSFWDANFETTSIVGNAPEAPLQTGNQWLVSWGFHLGAVYPTNTTVSFGFQADNVSLGTNNALVTTFWRLGPANSPSTVLPNGAIYSFFSTPLVGPVANAPVPEPATVALLGIGIAGLAGAEVRRRRKKKADGNI